jgi:hypothetical protein
MGSLLRYKHTKFSTSHKFPALPLEEQMAHHRKEKERIAPRSADTLLRRWWKNCRE